MDLDRVKLLIELLFDNTAREDERHDAAMDIGEYNDDRALNALTLIATNRNEDNIILDACGESIARILVKRNEFKKEILKNLMPLAKLTAEEFIKTNKPEWNLD